MANFCTNKILMIGICHLNTLRKKSNQEENTSMLLLQGMYCINRACSMRIGIEFPECVDCDWSIIESTAYAQAVRQESINILEVLSIEGQLSDDIYEFHKIRIQAAEKIMQSMNLNFEPYKIMTVPRDQL